jgi:hypothetical protein
MKEETEKNRRISMTQALSIIKVSHNLSNELLADYNNLKMVKINS